MKKYPFVRQPYLKDCGVSCLSMIIKYYKGNVPLSKLRNMTKTTRDGTSAYHIVNAANDLGFSSSGIKCEIYDIKKYLPCIAFVTIDNVFNHYIVIYEVDSFLEEFIIADPSSGIKTMSFDDFKSIWNNVILTFNLIKQPPIYKNHSIHFIKTLLKPHKFILFLTLLLSLLIVIFSIFLSYFFENLITGNVNLVCFIFLFNYVLKAILSYMRNVKYCFLSNKIDVDLTNATFSKIINLPYLSFCNKTKGEYISRMNDLNSIRNIITSVFLNLSVDLVISVFSLFLLFKISSFLTFILLIMVTLLFITMYIFKDKIHLLINEIKNQGDITSTIMVEGISGYETVKGINIENYVTSDFYSNYNNLINKNYVYQKLVNKEQLIKELIYNVFYITIMYFGIRSVNINLMSLGSLITYNTLLNFFLNPINELFSLDYTFKEAFESFKRIVELDLEENVLSGSQKPVSKSIHFIHASYTHMDRYKILEDISFSINEGEKVVIIGNSGSGKSTILKILSKKYPVLHKQVFIGSVDINNCSIHDLNISYISQNEVLFTKSIYENITLGKKVPDEKLQNVMKICTLDHVLLKNHMNLFTILEDSGSNLSGGEKQLIILARTLLRNSKIILIDEGLNQLDVYLERKVLTNLFLNYKNKTIIVVSHRLDNIDLFNHLLQIDKGKIVNNVCKEDVYEA